MTIETATFYGIEFVRKAGRWMPTNPESYERVISYWINGFDVERDSQDFFRQQELAEPQDYRFVEGTEEPVK